MSCRSNPGSSAVTSFARAGNGLGDMQTLSIFHQLSREGETAPTPTLEAFQNWQTQVRQEVQTDTRIGDGQRQRILNRLDNLNGYVPDGPTFHAWQHMNDTARMGLENQRALYHQVAAATGRSHAEVEARAVEIEEGVRARAARSPRQNPTAVLERARSLVQTSNNYLPQDQTSLEVYSQLMDEAADATQARATGMEFQDVDSSLIRRVGYRDSDGSFEVHFRTGQSYRYQGVPASLVRQLTDPDNSAGSVYNRAIRGHFRSEEITSTPVQNSVSPVQPEPVAVATEEAATTPTTRCPNCGQFAGEGGHNCPADVSTRMYVAGQYRQVNLGQLMTTEEGQRLLATLADSDRYRGGRDVITAEGQPNEVNISEQVRQLLAGRAAMAADQAGAIPPPTPETPPPTPVVTPTQSATINPRATPPRCGNCGRFMSAGGGHSCQSRPRATREDSASALARAFTPLAQARADSEAAQAAAVEATAAQPAVRQYREDMEAFQSAYDAAKARKEAGEPPVPFLTQNATGGLGARSGGRGFGVELEFDMNHLGWQEKEEAKRRIGQELHAAGLTNTPRQEGYHSSTDYSRWRFEADCTVDGEIISPIMYDTPEDWEKLQKVCDIIQRNGGKASVRTGGHVHVACSNYDHTPKNHNNLLKLFKKSEDILYRMSTNPDRGRHRGVRWCSPNQMPAREFTSVEAVRSYNNSHGLGLNFQSVQGRDNDHVEFRTYDGSLDPAVIQSQIKLSLAMTEAAFRAEEGAFREATPEPIGKHKRTNREQHGRRRITGEAWEADTASFREFTDRLFHREEDKEQMAALFAVTKWQST